MENITDLFHKFREVSRNLRNIYYLPSNSNDWATIDNFNEVSRILFFHLVLFPLNLNRINFDWFNKPYSEFRVLPKSSDCPIMINRETSCGYWDYPTKEIQTKMNKLSFISFFDWDHMSPIDQQYLRVIIENSTQSQEIIGKHALIEYNYCNIYYAKNK